CSRSRRSRGACEDGWGSARAVPSRDGAGGIAMGNRESRRRPSLRPLRVAEQARHLLADLLLRGALNDPRLHDASITVSEVRMSQDLRHGTVFVAELGRELRAEVLAALQHAAPFLGGKLAREINLKYAPQLRFVRDESFAAAARLERLVSDA